MSLSINLFDLIKSLSPHEKGYFKKQGLKSGASDKKYLILFECIEEQQTYDESQIKNRLKQAGFGGNLTNTKRYLLEMIAQSLVSYQLRQNPKLEIAHFKQVAEVMMAKKQYALSKEYLDKAEAIALGNELYSEQLIIANDRYRLAIRTGDYDYLRGMFNLYKQHLQGTILAIDEMWQLNVAQSHLVAFSAQFGQTNTATVEQHLAHIMVLPVFSSGKALLVVKHETMRLNILSLYNKLLGNKKLAYQAAQQLVLLYQQNPEQIKRIPRNYMSALVTLANRSTLVKDYKLLAETIKELIALRDSKDYHISNSLQVEINAYTYELRLMHMNHTANFEQTLSLQAEIEAYILENGANIKKENLIYYHYFLGYALFRHGENQQAYKLVKNLIDNYRDETREDHIINAHFLLFALHVELGYTELLPHTLNSIKYYLKTKQQKYQVVMPILKYFGAIIKNGKNKEKLNTAKQALLKGIQPYKTDHNEQALLNSFDFEWWTPHLAKS